MLSIKIARSVLVIQAEGVFAHGPRQGQRGYTTGTAFWVPEGILTALHTIDHVGRDATIFVYNPDMSECQAELIAADEKQDLALLRLKNKRKQFRLFDRSLPSGSFPFQLTEEETIEENTPVFAIEYSSPQEPTIMPGNFARNIDPLAERLLLINEHELQSDPKSMRASFHNMSCPPGFSGGPIIKTDGSLVSVVSTWSYFFSEVRGAVLSQLRQFLQNAR